MVTPGKDEVSDETFVAVYYTVATKLFRLLVVYYEFGRGHVANVTANGLAIHS